MEAGIWERARPGVPLAGRGFSPSRLSHAATFLMSLASFAQQNLCGTDTRILFEPPFETLETGVGSSDCWRGNSATQTPNLGPQIEIKTFQKILNED